MEGTLSVILSESFMNKMERDIVLPLSQSFTVNSLMTHTGEGRKMSQISFFQK